MLVSVSSRDREARGRSACLSWTSIFDYPEQLGRTHRRCAPKALRMWKSVLDDIFVPLLLISERKNRDSAHERIQPAHSTGGKIEAWKRNLVCSK